MYVIGAGQMRTGTNSLKVALEMLYNGKCYNIKEMFDYHQDHFDVWNSVLETEELSKDIAENILSEYCAVTDVPCSIVYKDLVKIYPDAKIILTIRNSDDWIISVRKTTMTKEIHKIFQWKFFFWIFGTWTFMELVAKSMSRIYKQPFELLMTDDVVLKKAYEEYNEEVKTYVSPERLLEFNVNEGWEPLCKFLNLPIPNEPFPFINSTEEFLSYFNRKIKNYFVRAGSFSILIVFSVGILVTNYLKLC